MLNGSVNLLALNRETEFHTSVLKFGIAEFLVRQTGGESGDVGSARATMFCVDRKLIRPRPI